MSAVMTAVAGTGEALDPRLYLDPAVLESEQARIFERTWQLIGHVSAVPGPQRLPAPRLAPAQRLGPVQRGDPLPLPRLDIQVRRDADRRS